MTTLHFSLLSPLLALPSLEILPDTLVASSTSKTPLMQLHLSLWAPVYLLVKCH